nr:protein trichome birefringence-like 34 [Ipomoea trifida]
MGSTDQRAAGHHASSWIIRYNLHSIIGSFLLAFVVVTFYMTGDTGDVVQSQVHQISRKGAGLSQRCNLFSGRWVYDNESDPLYKEQECSFMVEDFACQKYGRKNFEYQHWKWQPHDCDLPRFNATKLMEKLGGKRLIFVGDSLIKNQWMSLVCMVESSLAPSFKSSIWKGNLITFESKEYNATIDFYWSPLLVESNCDDPINHHVRDRIARIKAIEKHARHWSDADIVVFDSFMWWLEPTMTLLWGSFDSQDAVSKTVAMKLRRYEMALETWSDWLEFNVNRTRTQLFFMSLSPYHKLAGDWGMPEDQNCYNETQPISRMDYWGRGSDKGMMRTAERVIQRLESRGLRIQYMNITQLSDYRKDAHTSIYKKQWQPPTKEQLLDPKSYADCVHWCLPGVPDVWNQILYAYIMVQDS